MEHLISAITNRKSCRKYQTSPVDPQTLSELNANYQAIALPFAHDMEIIPFIAQPVKELYSLFVSPPDNVAFYAPTDIISQSKCGFAGELYVLLATSLGLSTCWYGHYKSEALFQIIPVFPDYDTMKKESWMGYGYSKGEEVSGKRAICITPLGYADSPNLLQKLQANISKKRKPITELMDKTSPATELNETIAEVLYSASLAPSAMNAQFWRFSVSADQRSITVAMPEGYKHIKWRHPNVDIGICACHIWIALKSKGLNPDVSISTQGDRAIWEFCF